MPDLQGLRIVVTRPRKDYAEFAELLKLHGASPICFPTIDISTVSNTKALDAALHNLAFYDWVVFTSANAVRIVQDRITTLGLSGLSDIIKVAAVGPKTAHALSDIGRQPDFIPDKFLAEAILPGLGKLKNNKILLLRANIAKKSLPEAITAAGGYVDDIAVYETERVSPDITGLKDIKAGVDVITFTSASTVKNFVSMMQACNLDIHDLSNHPTFAYIGPVTSRDAQKLNLPIDIVASEHTILGLTQALLNYYKQKELIV